MKDVGSRAHGGRARSVEPWRRRAGEVQRLLAEQVASYSRAAYTACASWGVSLRPRGSEMHQGRWLQRRCLVLRGQQAVTVQRHVDFVHDPREGLPRMCRGAPTGAGGRGVKKRTEN
jgi:hypothetical protein